MTLRQLTEELGAAGVPDARFDALQLIMAACGVSAAKVLGGGDFTSPALFEMAEKRKKRVPLQYILGEWEFMGYTFKVTPDCLIPRADTELLCSHLIDTLPQGGRFADLCTGSGCIAVSALKKRPDASAVAIELYPKTADVARQNSLRLGTAERLEIIVGDVRSFAPKEKFDVIVSNPPYVSMDEMNDISPEVSREPRAALTDGGDGLSIIASIIERCPDFLTPGGTLAVEIGWRQAEAVCTLCRKRGLNPSVLTDSGGRDRVVSMKV